MKIHHYFAIGLKLFSIVLFIYGVQYTTPLFEIYKFGTASGVPTDATYYVVNLTLIIIVSLYLWFFPVTTAKCFLGAIQNEQVKPLAKQDVLAVFIIAIGLHILAWSIIDIIYWCSFFYLSSSIAPTDEFMGADSKANIIATIIQLILGLGLILKSKRLAAAIFKVAS